MCARSRIASVLLAGLMLSTWAKGAPVLEQRASAESASSVAWVDELPRRVVSLASAPVRSEGSAERQSSPRYASYDTADIDGALFGCGWLFDELPAEERALLELAGRLLADRSGSILSRRLVERGLASDVEARLSVHGERTLFAVFVFGTPLGLHTNFGDVLDAAIGELTTAGPSDVELERLTQDATPGSHVSATRDAVRRVAARYLDPRRRSVVELVPRNAPEPAFSPKPPAGPARNAAGSRRATRRPIAAERAKRASHGGDPLERRTVRRGDTLTAIARRYKVTVGELARQNGIDPTRPIRVGQELVVPRSAAPARARQRPKPRSL